MNLNYHLKLTEKYKIMILIFSVLVIILILFFLVIIPSARKIKEIKAEIRTQRTEMEKKYLSGLNAKILSQKAPEINEKIAKAESILIKSEEQLQFVTSLEKIAEQNNLAQTPNIEYSSAQEEGFYKKIPLKLSTEGSLANQLTYLKDLKSLKYYINIESIQLKKSYPDSGFPGENNPEEQVSLFIQAQSYWAN